MIRFVADGAGGRVLGLGLSFGNLDLLAQKKPIVFDLGPYGQSGDLVILAGDQSDVTAATMVYPHVIGLTPRTLDTLRQGRVLPVELASIGITGLWQAVLFAGPTEPEIADAMRKAGLLGAATPVEWGDYDLHERNEAPGCQFCAERSVHPNLSSSSNRSPSSVSSSNVATPSSASSSNVSPARFEPPSLWRVWALFALLVAIAVILGILLAPSAGKLP